jgi:t-SNARE complex subunit (syntaxin)
MRVPVIMSNIEEDRQDTGSALPDTAPPAAAERKRPAWVMIAMLVALAIVVAVVIMTVIPNGAISH